MKATTWNPEVILRVAKAIEAELLTEEPTEFMRAVFLCGAARALEFIGQEIAKAAGNDPVRLPEPEVIRGLLDRRFH